MLGNLRIGIRLAVGFIIVLLLLIAVAFIGIANLATLDADIEEIANVQFAKTQLANGTQYDASGIHALMAIVVSRGSAEERKVDLDQIAGLKKIHLGEDGQARHADQG